MKILDIQHLGENGELLWESKDIKNLMHQDGEEYLLRIAFTGGTVPTNYHLGLDNRSVNLSNQDMDDLVGEPSGNGYQRQQVASSGEFLLSLESNHYVAKSPIVAFRATTDSWGPVSKLFLTDQSDDSGYLISTADLGAERTIAAGQSITMRIGMSLKGC